MTRHADVSGTTLSNLATLDRGVVGDGRASSANALIDEFIGDYNTVAATNAGAVSVFNDARDAAVCDDINASGRPRSPTQRRSAQRYAESRSRIGSGIGCFAPPPVSMKTYRSSPSAIV